MGDRGIIEREMLQIEQIRQLDSEELQVEEADGDSSSSSDDDNILTIGRTSVRASASGGFTFDTSLTSLHSYLGEVEDTHNRSAYVDGGAVLNLPLFYLEGVVLFPEATLPLRVVQSNFIAAVERALKQVVAPCTIGVVRVSRDSDNGRIKIATIGTTAEIRQFLREADGSVNVVARGQQRFRLRRHWIEVDGDPCGEIEIIQEDMPLRTPKDAVGRLRPLKNFYAADVFQARRHSHENENDDSDATSVESFESGLTLAERRLHHSALASYGESTSSDDEKSTGESEFQFGSSRRSHFGEDTSTQNATKIGGTETSDRRPYTGIGFRNHSVSRFRECSRAYWPYWVYQMHDSYCLAQRVADLWKHIITTPSMDGLVKKPDLLSFHVASKIPLSESTRQELLEIDGISYRLRREIELLENFDRIRCKSCQTLIAKRSDMLVMSRDGPLGAYANPHGYVHEIMTLLKTTGLVLIGNPSTEYSWFPGYAWTIAYCATCEYQMGWLFTATKKGLKPRSFWGIRSSQVADDMN